MRGLATELRAQQARIAQARASLLNHAKRGAPPSTIAALSDQLRIMLSYAAQVSAEYDRLAAEFKLGTPAPPAPLGRPPQFRMADCHPDRKHVAKGLCRSCNQAAYRERRDQRLRTEYLRFRETEADKGTP
jgi:hypothetical protein